MIAVDVTVQLMICLICMTMGSDERLRKFKMTLDLSSGAPKVIFFLINSIDEVESEDICLDESRNSTTSANSEL
jgi:hypothetical protein